VGLGWKIGLNEQLLAFGYCRRDVGVGHVAEIAELMLDLSHELESEFTKLPTADSRLSIVAMAAELRDHAGSPLSSRERFQQREQSSSSSGFLRSI
jgi:hypothetical protein